MARNGKTAPLGRLMWRMYSCDAQLQLSRDNCGWKAIESWISSPGFKFGANHQHRGCLWSKGLQLFGTLFVNQLDFSGILPDQQPVCCIQHPLKPICQCPENIRKPGPWASFKSASFCWALASAAWQEEATVLLSWVGLKLSCWGLHGFSYV